MKTVTIPFDLEMAKKIQSGEVEGKILDDYKTEYEIIKYDAKGNYPMIGVYFNEENSILSPLMTIITRHLISINSPPPRRLNILTRY